MMDHTPSARGSVDPLEADSLLLDALGSGGRGPAGDEVAAMLAAWRADLVGDEEPRPVRRAVPVLIPIPSQRRWTWRPRLVGLAVAAAFLTMVGGLSIAAVNGTPGSPLWPITRILNPARAHQLGAQDAIAQARAAVLAGRFDDARRLLDQADQLIGQVNDPMEANRLRGEVAAVRSLLQAALNGTLPGLNHAVTPHPGPSPGASGGGTAPGGSTPTLLPSLPLPSLTPSLPLPTLSPSLPLGL
jgi:hypothetical protein